MAPKLMWSNHNVKSKALPDAHRQGNCVYNTSMAYRLKKVIPAHYPQAQALFDGYPRDPLLHAIFEQRRPGRVYADEPEQPTSAVVWTETECLYIAAPPEQRRFPAVLRRLLDQRLIPHSKALGLDFLSIFAHPRGTPRHLEQSLADLEPLRTPADTFQFDPALYEAQRPMLEYVPDNLRLVRLDRPLLLDPENENLLDGILHYWGTIEAFLQRSRGYALLHDQQVVSWLYVQASGGGGQAPDSWTDPDYRGLGLASIIGSRWIQDCLAADQQPFWISDHANRASRRLAEHLGFEHTGTVDLVDIPFYPFEYYRSIARNFFLVNDSYREAALAFERSFKLGVSDPADYFLAAAAWMHAGEAQRALHNLHQAVDHGLEDLLSLEGAEAFESLHGTVEWEALKAYYLRSRRQN